METGVKVPWRHGFFSTGRWGRKSLFPHGNPPPPAVHSLSTWNPQMVWKKKSEERKAKRNGVRCADGLAYKSKAGAVFFVGADALPQGHWLHHPLILRGAYSRSAASGGRREAVARHRPGCHGPTGLGTGCRNVGRVAGAVRPLCVFASGLGRTGSSSPTND